MRGKIEIQTGLAGSYPRDGRVRLARRRLRKTAAAWVTSGFWEVESFFFLRGKVFFKKGWSRGGRVGRAVLKAAGTRVPQAGFQSSALPPGRLQWQALTTGHAYRALCRPVLPSSPERWELQAQHAQRFIGLVEVLCVYVFGPPTIFSWFPKEVAMESGSRSTLPLCPGSANAAGGSLPSLRRAMGGTRRSTHSPRARGRRRGPTASQG